MTDANVPGLGKLPKWGIVAMGVGGVGIVWYFWHKNSAANSAAAATDTGASGTGTQADQGTGAIDPTTGYPYGSVQDQEALAGSIPPFDMSGGSAGYPVGNGSSSGSYGEQPTTNAEWSQDVEQVLTSIGYDAQTVATAIGAYLNRQNLTSNQASIVQVAIAEVGPPPVGTFPIKVGSGGGQIKIPDVVGIDVTQAENVLRSVGLKGHGPAPTPGVIHVVTSTSPAVGTEVNSGTTVTLHTKSEGTPTPNQVTVPNVVGQRVDEATTTLSKDGLKINAPAPVKGKVHIITSQNPKAGTKARKGSTVIVHVKTV